MIPITEERTARLTREQRIVALLVDRLPSDAGRLEAVEARSQALPALLRRHGPVQVILFLAAKGAENNGAGGDRPGDRHLASWLVAGIAAAVEGERAVPEASQDLAAYSAGLAAMSLPAYLLHWEIAIEVAGWIKMLIGARLEESKQPPPSIGHDSGAPGR